MTLDAIELARELIRVPSPNPPGDECAAAAVIADAAQALGLPTARRIAREEHRPNLLATLDFGPGGRHLVLSGHLDPLAAAAEEACAEVLGEVPPAAVFPGTTDATWFAELQGTPALPALGPGLLRRAHAADEWVSVAATRRAVDLYAEVARRFCEARA